MEDEIDVNDLLRENRLLKQRVFELEQKLAKAPGGDTGLHHLKKIVEIRDKQVQTYTDELEKKNAQLQMWVSALRLYQEIFENDPSIMIGVNKDAKLVLYNKATLTILGDTFKENLNKHITQCNFSGLDQQIPLLVQEAMKAGKPKGRRLTSGKGYVESICYPLGVGGELRGALLKISIVT
jgi:transcriptional regulator with PAS, ATPase and Fis domain